MKRIEILPTLLASTKKAYEDQAAIAADLGSWVHIDFLDNSLVKGRSVSLSVITGMETTQKREVHLMVQHPEKYVDALLKAGVERFILHVEIDGEKDSLIQKIKQAGREIVLAVLDTSLIYPARPYLKDVDGITIMTVKAGKSGQKFLPAMVEKIRLVRTWYPDFPIEADGGITEKTAIGVVENGASRLAVHETLFKAKNPAAALDKLQQIVHRVKVKVPSEE